ncbi:ABC transporter ATP-binding protein [Celeribacter sp.]|uniref:ABC transporter ATP-binding protein n=1 Tax=Celeribacter sp. TaxID=1890673 RepID=UPI003A91D3CF
MMEKLLSVENLQTHFLNEDGVTRAVDGVSFDVLEGETLGIVGESGCGKSVTSLSIMGLLPDRIGRVVGGDIVFQGESLLSKSDKDLRDIRGDKIAMIFQEPMTSLNPVHKVGHQIAETVILHEGISKREARKRALDVMNFVRIPDAERRFNEYPHQFSGGMRQRAMIAISLACRPRLLIADEPTTALDVTIQAQILRLMSDLQKETGTSVIMITHDLGVVAETCDRVAVMYAGRIVEQAPVETLFDTPLHPYTRGLMTAKPRLGAQSGDRLTEIKGVVPALNKPIVGCSFAPRCPFATSRCHAATPDLRPLGDAHQIACFEAENLPPLEGKAQ